MQFTDQKHALATVSNAFSSFTPAGTFSTCSQIFTEVNSSRLDCLVSSVALLPAYKVCNEDNQHQPSKGCANNDGNKHLVLVHLTLLRWTQKSLRV